MTQLKQGRTESLQWRLWQPLYGPCVTLEHSYSQLESAACWFLVREENQRTRRKTLEAEKRTNTNSTHLWRWVRKSNPGHIGGRRALSPLHHPCYNYYITLCNHKKAMQHGCSPFHTFACLILFAENNEIMYTVGH